MGYYVSQVNRPPTKSVTESVPTPTKGLLTVLIQPPAGDTTIITIEKMATIDVLQERTHLKIGPATRQCLVYDGVMLE